MINNERSQECRSLDIECLHIDMLESGRGVGPAENPQGVFVAHVDTSHDSSGSRNYCASRCRAGRGPRW